MALLISLDYIYYNTSNRTHSWHAFSKQSESCAFLLHHTLRTAAHHRPAAQQTPRFCSISCTTKLFLTASTSLGTATIFVDVPHTELLITSFPVPVALLAPTSNSQKEIRATS